MKGKHLNTGCSAQLTKALEAVHASLPLSIQTLREDSEKVRRGLEDPTFHIGTLATFHFLAASEAFVGLSKVSEGVAGGWRGINISASYTELENRSRLLRWRHPLPLSQFNGVSREDVLRSACVLLRSLVVDNVRFHEYGVTLLRGLIEGSGGWKKGFDLEWLALNLADISAGRQLNLDAVEYASGSPYARLHDVWQDKAEFEGWLIDVCTYRCKRLTSTGSMKPDKWSFRDGHFAYLVPVEIMAIYAIRKRKELWVPELDHSVINSPFFNLDAVKFVERAASASKTRSSY